MTCLSLNILQEEISPVIIVAENISKEYPHEKKFIVAEAGIDHEGLVPLAIEENVKEFTERYVDEDNLVQL